MWKELFEDKKVGFVTTKLKGTTLIWWKELQAGRMRKEKGKILTWMKMKEKLGSKYLTSDYHTLLYQRLFKLFPGSRAVQEYIEEFDLPTLRNMILEDDEKRVVW